MNVTTYRARSDEDDEWSKPHATVREAVAEKMWEFAEAENGAREDLLLDLEVQSSDGLTTRWTGGFEMCVIMKETK